MRMTKQKPVSAGEILTEDSMKPFGISQMEMATLTGLPRKHLNQLCRDCRAVTVDTALILAGVFGNSADFWLNTQRRTDLWDALHTPERRARVERAKTLKR